MAGFMSSSLTEQLFVYFDSIFVARGSPNGRAGGARPVIVARFRNDDDVSETYRVARIGRSLPRGRLGGETLGVGSALLIDETISAPGSTIGLAATVVA
ncbi:MAG: hypothetical protein AAGI51_00185 [Pseudomonadota bacterium]